MFLSVGMAHGNSATSAPHECLKGICYTLCDCLVGVTANTRALVSPTASPDFVSIPANITDRTLANECWCFVSFMGIWCHPLSRVFRAKQPHNIEIH